MSEQDPERINISFDVPAENGPYVTEVLGSLSMVGDIKTHRIPNTQKILENMRGIFSPSPDPYAEGMVGWYRGPEDVGTPFAIVTEDHLRRFGEASPFDKTGQITRIMNVLRRQHYALVPYVAPYLPDDRHTVGIVAPKMKEFVDKLKRQELVLPNLGDGGINFLSRYADVLYVDDSPSH